MAMAFGNAGRRFGTGTRLGWGGYLPRTPGAREAEPVQQGYPTRTGRREADGTDLDPARGYQDELELNFPIRR